MVLVSLAISIPSIGQEATDYSANRNELNLGYFNAFALSSIGELGVGYKRLSEKGAFRIGMGMDISSAKSDYEYHQTKNSGYQITPRIGYEFHQWYNRIRLNYGVDVVSSFGSSTYENIYEDPTISYTNHRKSISAGLRPILGLTVYLNKSISISTETYMDISFSKSTTERNSNDNTTIEESSGMNVGLGPLGIVSVNFHF